MTTSNNAWNGVKYRRKALTVDAVQYDGSEECAKRLGLTDFDPIFGTAVCETPVDMFRVASRWWIVTLANGTRRSYHPTDFAALFEPEDPAP